MKSNPVAVPFYCFSFQYNYIDEKNSGPSNEKKLKMTQEHQSMAHAHPPLSNPVLSRCLETIRDGYIQFKEGLMQSNPWLFADMFVQDEFFINKLTSVVPKINKCKYANIALWSKRNIKEYCVGTGEDDDDLLTFIVNLNNERLVGFTADMNQKGGCIEVLVYHHQKYGIDASQLDLELKRYGLPEEGNNDNGDY